MLNLIQGQVIFCSHFNKFKLIDLLSDSKNSDNENNDNEDLENKNIING